MPITGKDDVTRRAAEFHRLHTPGKPLLLPNAWDAGSARLIESCGAAAIATTSAGLAWSHGYPDGDTLPTTILAAAIAEIARVLSVPLTEATAELKLVTQEWYDTAKTFFG